jgi:hypothetical protein
MVHRSNGQREAERARRAVRNEEEGLPGSRQQRERILSRVIPGCCEFCLEQKMSPLSQ